MTSRKRLIITLILSAISIGLLASLGSAADQPLPDLCSEDTVWCSIDDTDPYAFKSQVSVEDKEEQQARHMGVTESEVTPGVYLHQLDNGRWRVESYRPENPDSIPSLGLWSNPWPDITTVYSSVDMTQDYYLPSRGFELGDGSGRRIPFREMDGVFIYQAKRDPSYLYEADTKYLEVHPGNKLVFAVEVGGMDRYPHAPIIDSTGKEHYERYEQNPQGHWKYNIGYKAGMFVSWTGYYFENKKITLEGDSVMAVGTTQQLKAMVNTAIGETPTYDPTKASNVSGRTSETTFELLSGNSVISLAPGGQVTALTQGTAKVKVTWKKDIWWISTTMDIVVGNDPPPPGGGSGRCVAPSKINSMKNTADTMLPNVTGKIKADDRDAEKFDVSKGIPTTETLYANVLSKDYLYENDFGQWQGDCTYPVTVTKTYNLSWTVEVPYSCGTADSPSTCYRTESRSDSETVSKTYNIRRIYRYWALDLWNAYRIEKATANNYALPNGEITLYPRNYTPPNIQSNKLISWTDHVTDAPYSDLTLPSQSLSNSGSRPSIPNEDWTSNAEGQVGRVSVVNDSLVIDGQKVMDNVRVEESGPTPGTPRAPQQINRDTLYERNQMIDATKLNGWDYPSKGDIFYSVLDTVGTSDTKRYPIPDYNPVTIHTPVVNYSTIPDINRPFDQSLNPDRGRIAFVLDRDQNLVFPNNGQHRSILGYGNKDYTKYVKEKRIRFPFDMYKGNTFYAANSWIPLDVAGGTTTFHIPPWIPEGTYTVRSESWALNAPNTSATISERNANLDLVNYGAYETFDVKVLGRVYDFRVYDIGDLRWKSVFKTNLGQWTGIQYYSGDRNRDGNPSAVTGNKQLQLPIRLGSHLTEKGNVAHNGYPFLFFFNTMGNVWNANEGVKITPRFYFVSNDGTARQEVDLYYNSDKAKMIKVGSPQDTAPRVIKMGDPLRGIDSDYLKYSLEYEYNNFLDAATKSRFTLNKYITKNARRELKTATGYKDMYLDLRMRTLVGQVTEPVVSQDVQKRAVQRWFGEYNLPIDPYILPKGTNLEQLTRTKYKGKITGKESEFLKKGYIVVNFDISTYRDNKDSGIFAYDASQSGSADMWNIESEVKTDTSWKGKVYNFRSGDIMMFESDFSVKDDYSDAGW